VEPISSGLLYGTLKTHQASIQYDTCSINSMKYQNNDLRADTVKKSPARKIHMRKIP
jgi:hypothetical protein